LFRIKICGVTTAKDAQFVTLAGADAIGLNFYAQSRRFVDPTVAEAIVAALPPRVARVGVFVNHGASEIGDLASRLKLDWIQLHGDEPAQLLADLPPIPVLRAFAFDDSATTRVREYVEASQRLNAHLSALLIDASHDGETGGTGKTLDWKLLADTRGTWPTLPLVLAGGLTPFNVAEAIATAKPDAVDVASGVESKPGSKDLLLVRAFVTAAKKGLGEAGK
jgi:phosphoribosylanthranilate isomerase